MEGAVREKNGEIIGEPRGRKLTYFIFLSSLVSECFYFDGFLSFLSPAASF